MQKYRFFSIICYVEFQKTAYQKSGHSHFAYSNKRKMAKIAYQDKRKSQKSFIAISIFAFFLVSVDTSVPLSCCLPIA